MTATRIRGDDGIAWAVAPFLERLADLAIRGEVPEAHDRVVESVVELVESLCASVIESDRGRRSSSRAELLLRAHAHAESHLGDPSLAPGEIAAAVHVSKRYLHRLFEDDGSTVSGWIRRRRLEGCRRDLADPSRRGRDGDEHRRPLGLDEPRPPEQALPRRVRPLADRVPRGAAARPTTARESRALTRNRRARR